MSQSSQKNQEYILTGDLKFTDNSIWPESTVTKKSSTKEKKSKDKQLNISAVSTKKAKKPIKIPKKLKTPDKSKTDRSKSARKRAESESEDELAADTLVIPLSAGSKAVMKIVDYLKP